VTTPTPEAWESAEGTLTGIRKAGLHGLRWTAWLAGATGLAQCSELNWQLRGQADKRQVEGAKVALQHNLGLGGAAVVTMYRKMQA